jgi:heptaprenyl diphosphate synthase
MKNRSEKIQKLTLLGLCASVALLLSYVEAMIPPLFSAIPGIKMGLPNVVIVFVLYRYGVRDASLVSVVRLIIVAMLFGTVTTFMYSLAGAVLSLLVMAILKKLDFLSTVGVSVAGGVCHNIGQIIVAMILLNTAEIGYYMIVLAITGTIAGILIGISGAFVLKRFPKKI